MGNDTSLTRWYVLSAFGVLAMLQGLLVSVDVYLAASATTLEPEPSLASEEEEAAHPPHSGLYRGARPFSGTKWSLRRVMSVVRISRTAPRQLHRCDFG